MPFLPTTKEEAHNRGWAELDVVFVSGDAYVDHPSFGVPLLARLLESRGYRVGIIAQPDWRSKESFMVFGRPKLFFAVSAGAMDSMVAHYTPARKLRRDDAYTPGNKHGARPNRACIVYTSRIKEAYKDIPVVIGGIEASLRRFAHYDYWENCLRRSILLDAKADLLVFGMGEKPLLQIAERMRCGEPITTIRNVRGTGFCAASTDELPGNGYKELPTWEQVQVDKRAFAEAFRCMEYESNPWYGTLLFQRYANRIVACNPPAEPLTEKEMDEIYALPFEKAQHPGYQEPVPAYLQIRSSITTHRGCFGGCSFCAIALHQGTTIQSRSESSIVREINNLSRFPWFTGTISDLGGPTANMYATRCGNQRARAVCRRQSCLYPEKCKNLSCGDARLAALLVSARQSPKVKHVYISSGVRPDLLVNQPLYSRELLRHHVGGLLKVAPEHFVDSVTSLMRKPGSKLFSDFLLKFRKTMREQGLRYSVVPYIMSGHPGCTIDQMVSAADFLKRNHLRVEQVQDFTPTPGTYATCMYYVGFDPATGERLHVPRSDKEKAIQKSILLFHLPEERARVIKYLQTMRDERTLRRFCTLFGTTGEKGGRTSGARCDNAHTNIVREARKNLHKQKRDKKA